MAPLTEVTGLTLIGAIVLLVSTEIERFTYISFSKFWKTEVKKEP